MLKFYFDRSHNQGWRPEARPNGFLYWGCPYDMGQFWNFINKLPHRVRHARVHAARISADVAREKWRPAKFKKYFDACGSLLNTFISVGILLKYFRRKQLATVWVKWDSVEFRYVPLYITDHVVAHCFFYKSSTVLHSTLNTCWRLTALPLQSKKLVGCIWVQCFRTSKFPYSCHMFARISPVYRDQKVKR